MGKLLTKRPFHLSPQPPYLSIAERIQIARSMPEALLRTEGTVFVLDAEHPFVANLTQQTNVSTPLDVAKPRDHIPPPAAARR